MQALLTTLALLFVGLFLNVYARSIVYSESLVEFEKTERTSVTSIALNSLTSGLIVFAVFFGPNWVQVLAYVVASALLLHRLALKTSHAGFRNATSSLRRRCAIVWVVSALMIVGSFYLMFQQTSPISTKIRIENSWEN